MSDRVICGFRLSAWGEGVVDRLIWADQRGGFGSRWSVRLFLFVTVVS